MKLGWFVTALAMIPVTGIAQARPGTARAAASITEADVRRRIETIAHDSMGGRDTPSPGLEKTAQWVAAEFQRLGLRPAGDSGGYIQRYQVNLTAADPDSSFLEFRDPSGPRVRLRIGADLVIQGVPPRTLTTMGLVLVGGTAIDTAQLTAELIGEKLVVVVADWSAGVPQAAVAAAQVAVAKGARGVLLPVNSDSVAQQIGMGAPATPQVRRGPPRPATASAGGRFFGAAREQAIVAGIPEAAEQLAQLRSAPGTVVTPADGWEAAIVAKLSDPVSAMVPNTVGILEGTDPVLKNEYLVISAHMDHVGSGCGGGTPTDRICNGADDDASGTVGVVELAEAFVQAPPRRSVIFLTVSGEEKGLFGSGHFADHPPVDVAAMVANLNMDMIGRNWRDTIVAIGKAHSDLGATAERVAAANPDLGLRVIDDLWPEENLYGRSDHFNFARKGVPILFFTSGLHPDYHAVTDTPDKIDAEKESRILKLVFHLGQEIGNAAERPKWNPESYQRIVRRQGQVP